MSDMGDPDPLGVDLLRNRATRRLPADAACVLCGERDREVLGKRPASSVQASVLELHHVGGRANDPDMTVVLCLNCHRRMSDRMPLYGVDLGPDPNRSTAERLVRVLRGLAVFFEHLARGLIERAHESSPSSAWSHTVGPGPHERRARYRCSRLATRPRTRPKRLPARRRGG